jgi:hypothetical protein
MQEAPTLDLRSSLTLQWRNAVALLMAAILLGGLGIAILLLGLGAPEADARLLGLVPLGLAAPFGGYAAYLFRVVARGEERLQGMGTPWTANRSLLGTTRRSIVTDVPPDEALSMARNLLTEPRWGLIHVGKSLLGGLHAVRPAETGPVVMDVVPLAVGIRARRREGRTVLTLSVVPSSVYGWPPLTGWFVWSGGFTWIGVAQALVDDLASTLAQSTKATANETPTPPSIVPV